MRIKKIEWESSDAVLVGKMILGSSARVYPVYTDTDFMWSISDGSGRVVEQARKFVSLKQAIEECNEAWEKMFMKAFEPEEGCGYCRREEPIIDAIGDGIEVTVCNMNGAYVLRGLFDMRNPKSRESDINYCPMCGRKL